MTDLKDFHENLERMNAAQSKINIYNNIDNFAIEFSEWLARNHYVLCNVTTTGIHYWENEDSNGTTKELLQIFKEQRR